ncbi:methyl-accepting chemotaxis protein [Vibrio metschnikovii]|uniref:methyl-accepting chemotaxis protein n=1 Tax=Vibrio metschnikovii TaxID=28172 RepID=UPI001C2F37C3|nr:methyl-accepting chemotaxis protein [Vibrio metschnikovii]
MPINFIVFRVYLGFFVIIFMMLFSGVVLFKGNERLTSSIEFMTQESTPLMLHSGELTIRFLNINRSLNSYLFAMYIDDLEPLKEAVNLNVKRYKNQLDWFDTKASQEPGISDFLIKIKEKTNESFGNITQILEDYARYIELREENSYQKMLFQSLAIQLNSNLFANLEKTTHDEEREAVEALLTQVGLLLGEVNEAFSLQDVIETRAIERRFNGRKERFDEAILQFKSSSPSFFQQSEASLALLEQQIFSPSGTLAQHVEVVELYDHLQHQRESIKQDIEIQLKNIDALSAYAAQTAELRYLESSSQAEKTLMTLIIVSLISVVMALLIGLSIANMIRKPSQRLQEVLDKVASKDLTQRIQLSTTNELGRVSTKVNLVIDDLSHIIRQIRGSATQLNGASLENQQTSEALNLTIGEQTSQTALIATSMEEIESAVNNIACSANQTLSIVTAAVEDSTSGQAMMQKNVQLLNQLSQRLNNSTQTIHQLESESAGIESILDVISGISEQTNLLALNAAIEAARAGEQGRGFSVVADEVRVLASKATTSTQEIQLKIEQLQNCAALAVKQITTCVSDMANCITHTNDVSISLSHVHAQLNQIEDRSHQIASATTQHQLVAEEVTHTVSQIQTLAKQNLLRSQQLTEHSQCLERMAEHQSRLTELFKLSDNTQ